MRNFDNDYKKNLISRSFKFAGISIALDGSEDYFLTSIDDSTREEPKSIENITQRLKTKLMQNTNNPDELVRISTAKNNEETSVSAIAFAEAESHEPVRPRIVNLFKAKGI